MKIFDCTTFYSEHMMMDIRFNILDKHVHKFVVVESLFSHSGEKKKLNFDIKNYPKFKDKIIYLVIEKEPEGIVHDVAKINQKRCVFFMRDYWIDVGQVEELTQANMDVNIIMDDKQ